MKYEITKEQLQELAKGNAKVERWFPEAFETKFEIGKWYKVDGNKCGQEGRQLLANYSGKSIGNYGFDFLGRWGIDLALNNEDLGAFTFEATESEVFEALKKEAVKRGYIKGAKVRFQPCNQIRELECDDFRLGSLTPEIYLCNGIDVIFSNGEWQEIIKERTLSKSEAEAKLNELINDGYDYKIA